MVNPIKKIAKKILPALVYDRAHKTWLVARKGIDDTETFLRSRSGFAARFVRHSRPMSGPWRRMHLDIGRRGGMGDVLMCTPALRQLKAKNPAARIRFYTDYPALVRGLPYIDEVFTYADLPKGAIILRYEDSLPPRAHFSRILGDNLGVNVREVRPDCVIGSEAVRRFRELWSLLPRPHVIVQRRASRWTANKDWPDEYWVELIESLSQQASIIEIGNETSGRRISLPNYADLRTRTSLEDLTAVIAAGNVFVGPPSGPAHVAAAAGIPAVVIIGGYEHSKNGAYRRQVSFYSAVSCAPCWLRAPCPYDLKCLKMIQPHEVEKAIWGLWGGSTSVLNPSEPTKSTSPVPIGSS